MGHHVWDGTVLRQSDDGPVVARRPNGVPDDELMIIAFVLFSAHVHILGYTVQCDCGAM